MQENIEKGLVINMQYQKAVTFSYDDGVTQDRRLVEIFNRYGMKATFNLNTGIQTEKSCFEIDGTFICRMNQEDIGELYRGHEIAVHGLTHAGPSGLSEAEKQKEFGEDIENITRLYGIVPVGMAYAYGDHDEATVKCLRDHGILYGRTVECTHGFDVPSEPLLLKATCHHDDEKLFTLAQEFLEKTPDEGERMLFYVWGHSYEFDVYHNWDRIEKLCQMLAGRDDIYYGTNRECLELFGVIHK